MKFILSIFPLLCFVSWFPKTEQIISNRSCRDFNIQPMKYFVKRLFDGKWYVKRLQDHEESINQHNLLWNYEYIDWLTSKCAETSKHFKTNEPRRAEGIMNFDKRGSGQFTFVRDVATATNGVSSMHVNIIDTDYKTYAVEWGCVDIPETNQSQSHFFISTRDPNPDKAIIDHCEKILRKNNVDIMSMRSVKHGKNVGVYP